MEDELRKRIMSKRFHMGLAVMEQYSWFMNSYILDFFVDNHFEKLPQSWRDHFKNVSVSDVGKFLDFEKHKCNGVWPLSLLCLRTIVKYTSLSRRPDTPMFLPVADGELENDFYPRDEFFKTGRTNKVRNENRFHMFTHPKLTALLSKHVKPKKKYEVWRMAEASAETAAMLAVKHVVDVGSGLGHLSRVSAYGFGLNVLSIESKPELSEEAKRIDMKLEDGITRYLSDNEARKILQDRPIHINMTITEDVTPTDFLKVVRKAFKGRGRVDQFGIIGLHPCGNLTSRLLKFFVHCREVKFINVVGCCYHKTTASSENDEATSGFPLSSCFGKKVPDLRFEAKSLACHALEIYSKRLIANNYHHLKVHCFRATLEYIISKNWPQYRKTLLCNVKHGEELTFELYCEKALEKLKLSVPKEDLESSETCRCLSQWKYVVIHYSLRLLLAPLIESIIMMDRMLYIIENGNKCNVRALFQPEISPRNLILTALKDK